jgi:hypothetical protein
LNGSGNIYSDGQTPKSTITAPNDGAVFPAGEIELTGAAEGPQGVAFVEVSTDGGATWSTAAGNGSWSYRWAPASGGEYTVMSRATGTDHRYEVNCPAIHLAVTDAADGVSVSLTTGETKAKAGDDITWNASASGGSGRYEYQFLRRGGDTWGLFLVAQDWSANPAWIWHVTTDMYGSNMVMVKARNADGAGEAWRTALMDAGNPAGALVVTALAPNAKAAKAGDKVNWTAKVAGGSGKVEFQFLRKGPDTGGIFTTARDWSPANGWTMPASKGMAGSNTVVVKARNSDGSGDASLEAPAFTVEGGFQFACDDPQSVCDRDGLDK